MQRDSLRSLLGLVIGLALLLGACAPASPQATATLYATRAGTLKPFTGLAGTATLTPGEPDTPTPLPSATPTPRSHTVRKGEDMFGIALRYGVTLDDLMKANPTVDPRWLSIGTVLIVPAALYTPTPDPKDPPQPTPVGLALDVPNCFVSGDGGVWCFLSAENSQEFSVEGLSVNIRLYDRDSGQIIEKSAYPPLNLLTPGGFLPLAAYFPPPAPQSFDASAELLSALPVPADSGRYLGVQQSDVNIDITEDGLMAQVSGTLYLADAAASARSLRVAAAALDASGRIVGLRRWDSAEGLSAGATQPFELLVYSAGPAIENVIVLAEAIP
jgi:LysM repeat protein